MALVRLEEPQIALVNAYTFFSKLETSVEYDYLKDLAIS